MKDKMYNEDIKDTNLGSLLRHKTKTDLYTTRQIRENIMLATDFNVPFSDPSK